MYRLTVIPSTWLTSRRFALVITMASIKYTSQVGFSAIVGLSASSLYTSPDPELLCSPRILVLQADLSYRMVSASSVAEMHYHSYRTSSRASSGPLDNCHSCTNVGMSICCSSSSATHDVLHCDAAMVHPVNRFAFCMVQHVALLSN